MQNLFRTVYQKTINYIRHSVCWLWRYGVVLLSFSLFFIAFIPGSSTGVIDVWRAIDIETTGYHFDFINWELQAIAAKLDQMLFSQDALMSETDRSQFVRDYNADFQHLQEIESSINTIYSDPTVKNPDEQSHDLRTERDSLQEKLNQSRPLAEAILEGQVAAVLDDEGFGIAGQLWPPMAMHFTGMPNLLVLSPRDKISVESSVVIVTLPVDKITALESEIEAKYDVSALVVPLGGIALYPAMIRESSLSYTIETFAHEWLHQYLAFHPLGWSYLLGDENSRKINETTADLFGKEIAAELLARYYPEIPPPALPSYEPAKPIVPDPNAFDFNAAMYETRVKVDELLADGKINEAEAYMEERRVFLYEHGYHIRRLNQAYFAFYGRYQASSSGASVGGTDPIGPAIIAIHQNSDSIHDFVSKLQNITSLEELLNLKETKVAN